MNELAEAMVRRAGPRATLYAVALGEFAGAPETERDLADLAVDALQLRHEWPDVGVLVDLLRRFAVDEARRSILRGALGLGTPAERELSLAAMAASTCEPCLTADCSACPGASKIAPLPGAGVAGYLVLCTCAGQNHPETLPS